MKTCKAIHLDLRTLFDAGAMESLSDGELLELFISRRDEPAFEAIVRRHGPTKRFEDHPNPSTKHLEGQMTEMAKQQIRQIHDRPKKRPAPATAPKPER